MPRDRHVRSMRRRISWRPKRARSPRTMRGPCLWTSSAFPAVFYSPPGPHVRPARCRSCPQYATTGSRIRCPVPLGSSTTSDKAFLHKIEPALFDWDIALQPGFDFIHFIYRAALDSLHNVGLPELSAVGDCRVAQSHLEWSGQVKSLPYGYGDSFTLLPWNAGSLFFPPGGGDEPWVLAMKSYARSFPKSEHCHILSQSIDAQFEARLVKENVTAFDYGPFHCQGAVAVVFPATVLAISELKVTGTGEGGGRANHPFLERRKSYEGLVGGPGRISSPAAAVQQRMTADLYSAQAIHPCSVRE